MSPTIDPNPFSAPSSGEPPPEPVGQMEVEFLAERSTRLVGSMIDGFLFVLAAVPAFVIFAQLGAVPAELSKGLITVGGLSLPVLILIGYQWYLISTTGQSLAKKWLKMKIVKMNGTDVDFVSGVILRSWVVQAMGLLP